jgi:hypothetical protein
VHCFTTYCVPEKVGTNKIGIYQKLYSHNKRKLKNKNNQPNSVKMKTREHKLKSGVNW